MPHSSGGGSHGGGSHSGSHSSGGSHSSSSSYSSEYFKGCKHRYVYYKRNKPAYIYSNKTLEELQKPLTTANKIASVLVLLPFLAIAVFMFLQVYQNPQPLSTNYNTCIAIEDNIGIIADEEALLAVLTEFQITTGITPAVLTIANQTWQAHYSSLENYAYDYYVNNFADEKHWLIAYSEELTDDGFIDWYWEGMQGDDTDSVLTERETELFTESFQKYLLQDEFLTVDQALVKAFAESTARIMQPYFDDSMLKSGLIYLALVLFVALSPYFERKKMAKLEEVAMAETKDEAKSMEVKCAYCGGIYVKPDRYVCPYCGAPLS